MSEASSYLEGEPVFIKNVGNAVRSVTHAIEPSFMAANIGALRGKDRVAFALSAATEMGGVIATAMGNPEGLAAVWSGKMLAVRAERKSREASGITGPEYDSKFVQAPTAILTAAAKAFLPSIVSTGEMKDPFYKKIVAGATRLEIPVATLAATAAATGNKEMLAVTGGLYGALRFASLTAEWADRKYSWKERWDRRFGRSKRSKIRKRRPR